MKETDTGKASAVPDEEALSLLQRQIREIIDVCEHLRVENLNLRKQASDLMTERRGLVRVNETARERLQIIIGRLRELENSRPGSKSRSG